jgi:hypothetical protein
MRTNRTDGGQEGDNVHLELELAVFVQIIISLSSLYGQKTWQFFNKKEKHTECWPVFPIHA